MAKALLKREGLEFEAINLDNDHELRMKLSEENNGYCTVPMIFIDEKFIGGLPRASKDASKRTAKIM